MAGDQCGQLTDDVRVAAEGQIRIETAAEHGQAALLQRRDFQFEHPALADVNESRPAPYGQGTAKQFGRRAMITALRGRPAGVGELPELLDVDPSVGRVEQVAVLPGLQDPFRIPAGAYGRGDPLA